MSGAVLALGSAFKGITAAASAIGTKIVGAGAAMFGMGGAAAASTGILGKVIGGALTGGVMSKLSGGKFGRGALVGGAMGLMGGLMGGGAQPQGGNMVAQTGMQTPPMQPSTLGTGGLLSGVQNPAVVSGVANAGAATAGTAGMLPGVTGAQAAGGGLLGAGGWLERNQMLAGNVIGGVGQGLMAGMQGKAAAKQEEKARRRIEGTYEIDYAPTEFAVKPNERPRFRYDRESGTIVYG